MSFEKFKLSEAILQKLSYMNIKTPTPVQTESIPLGLDGRDILASAQTGTGKTIAYLIPLITNVLKDPRYSGLVLTPTRELAVQVKNEAQKFLDRDHVIALLIGGESMFRQIGNLKRRPKLIIGTPGRIRDHLERQTLKLNHTKFLVLDETDRMLDMGFSEDLDAIIDCLPKERQTFMFSATLPKEIERLSNQYLTNPERVSIGEVSTPSIQVTQNIIQTSSEEKKGHLLKELDEREGSVIVFVKTKLGADDLSDELRDKGYKADVIHGDLQQRRREQVVRAFRGQKFRILVATDVASRGLDIPHVMHVINYDLPQCPEDYIHRIGRTGRAGAEGFALSLIEPADIKKWHMIHKIANMPDHLAIPREARSLDRRSPNGRKKFSSSGKFGYEKRGEPRSFKRSDAKPFRKRVSF